MAHMGYNFTKITGGIIDEKETHVQEKGLWAVLKERKGIGDG